MVALTTKVLFASCLVLAIGIYFYPRDDSFHHFYLSLQWPASFCNIGPLNKCFRPVPGNFTIHGLWAQTSNDEQYKCDTEIQKEICDKHPFNYEELKNDADLMEIMNKRWPNLIKGRSSQDHQQNKKFWTQEWERHGCCTFKSKQKEYFKKTCELMWEQAPLLEIFAAHKPPITPGRNKKYSLSEYIEAAIQTGLKVEPGTFICNKKIQRKRTYKQLVEDRLCTDKEVTKFIGCPGLKSSRSCGKYSTKIAFPR